MHEASSSGRVAFLTMSLSEVFVVLSGVWSLYLESVFVYVWSLFRFQNVTAAIGEIFCFLEMDCIKG